MGYDDQQWSAVRQVRRNRRRLLWTVGGVVAVAAATTTAVVVIDRQPAAPPKRAARPPATSSALPAGHPSSAPPRKVPTRTVRVTALQSDGQTYGVGLPIVLYFSPAPRDVRAFERAATVTVDGRPAGGAWFWEQPNADEVRRHVVEAHYRPQAYWPAHARIHVAVPIGGLSAGRGLAYSRRLTSLDYRTGAAHVSTVVAGRLTMRVTSDGHLVRSLKVSLGAAATPTFNGIKVVMQKGEDVPGTGRLRPNGTVLMSGPGYTDHPVPWSVRITRQGEYVHAAPWNHQIGQRSTSNGCTNLAPGDAEWFYGFSRVGDIVQYAGTDGRQMAVDDGFGDWNVPWSQWREGGPARPGA